MVAVLLAAAALRLVALGQVPPGLSHDEAYNGVTALEVWLLGRRDIFFEIYNGIEPLIIYWEALYLKLFGITPVAMRLVNVTAGLLTIPLTFALARRLLAYPPRYAPGLLERGPSAYPHLRRGRCQAALLAALAALGVGLSFWAVFVSRLTLRAVTLPLLELPAFYCLWRGLAGDGQDLETRLLGRNLVSAPLLTARRLAYFALGGACLGAAMYTYLSSRFLPFVPLLFFAYWLARGQARGAHWLGMGVFFTAWGLVFAPLASYYLRHPDVFGRRAGQVLNLPLALAGDPRPLIADTLRTLGMFSVVGPDTSRYGLAARPVFDPLGALFFHVGLIVSLARLRRSPREAAPYAFLLIWWLVLLAPGFITGESPHFLRTIGALPPSYIFWALGILAVGNWALGAGRSLSKLRKPRPAGGWALGVARRWAIPALAVYLALSGWLTVRDYFGRWANDAEARAIYGADFTEVARYLEAADSDDPVVLSAAYYRDWDRFRLDLQTHHSPPFVVWFDGRQTFLLPPPGSGLNPIYIFPRSAPPHPLWLDFLRLETRGADMSVYRLRPEAVDGVTAKRMQPIADGGSPAGGAEALPETVQLLGYQVVPPAGPRDAEFKGEARAGESLRVLLHWQPLRDVAGDPDYAFYAHLRDRRDYTWAQADANGYAVVDWQPGVQVLQWLELPLPPDLPPLAYRLVVGLEDRGTGQSLTVPVTLSALTAMPAARAPSPDSLQVPNAVEVTAGEVFTLRGYSLDPRWLQPGDSTHVTLYWEARTAPGADHSLALWLVDAAGARIELGDRQPLDGDYPTSRWAAGQWVRDRFDLTLPHDLAGGLYQVVAGWRDPAGAWLLVEDKPDIALGEIFIPNP
jgi:hypothetical protein